MKPQQRQHTSADTAATAARLSSRPGLLGRMIRSPFFYVALWASLSSILYLLQWSDLYATQARGGLVFIGFVIIVFGAAAALQPNLPSASPAPKISSKVLALLTLYYVTAFAATGGVPLLLVLRGDTSYQIYSFGLHYLQVPVLAFSGYYALRCMDCYLRDHGKAAMGGYALIMTLLLLSYNRSALSFLVFATFVIILIRRRVGLRRAFKLAATGIAFIAAFGYLGTRRLNFQIAQATGHAVSGNAILSYSGANQRFFDTGLPDVFMWAYLYVSSPIANFLASMNYAGSSLCGLHCNLNGLFVYSLMPDILGSRVGQLFGMTPLDKRLFLIRPDLTTATVFGTAVGYAGLIGGLIMVLALLAISILAIRIFSTSQIQAVGISLLITFLFFCFFSNMIAYSPLSLQLIFAMVVAAKRQPNHNEGRSTSSHNPAPRAASAHRLRLKLNHKGTRGID